MKKSVSRVLIAVFSLLIIVNFSYILLSFFAEKKAEKGYHIAFSNGELFVDSEELYFDANKLFETQSQYSSLRSNLHYNALSTNQQKIYRAYEFALENSYTNILVDKKLSEDVESLFDTLMFLALDSPLLEQNLRYGYGNCTCLIPIKIGPFEIESSFEGYYITVYNFEKSVFDKKLEAIDKAKEIVNALPDGLSDIDKAERLYTHLRKNTEYLLYDNTDEDEMKVNNYLYDSLITGATHCDGFANGYSLLLRLAGIEIIEKHYSPQEDSDKTGHTWTAFKIDSNWYNADATGDTLPAKDSTLGGGIYFAFSDELLQYKEDYADISPECINYYITIDKRFENVSYLQISSAVKTAFSKRNPDWSFIIIEGTVTEETGGEIAQRVANYVNKSITWLNLTNHNGNTILFFCEKGFI